jgi:DNA-binding transcriptional LysR family regulator
MSQLAELEDRLGFVLFKRSSQRFEVTEAGAPFLEHVRIALAEIERAIHSGSVVSHGSNDEICIAKSPYFDP